MQEQKAVQVAGKKKEQQLQTHLDTVRRMSQARDQQIAKLEQELQKQKTLHTPSVENTGVQADYLAIAPGSLRRVEVCGETVLEVVGETVQVTGKGKEQQLQADLDTVKRMSRAKDQQILMLERELQEQKIVQVASKEKEQQLQAKVNAVWHISRAKDRQITMLWELQKQKALHMQSVEDSGVQANFLAVAPGFLRGVEICGETVLEVVGDKSQKLEWPGHGFCLEVPVGALPPGVTVSVAVKAILAGQFQLPEGRQLISAIYCISASEVFLEEVAVNIQHCAVIRSEEECSKFRFIIAKCSQELPYRFREKEGVFNPYTQYATIKLKRFSLVGATAPESSEICYAGLTFYKQIPTLGVEFTFIVVHNIEEHLEYVERKQTHNGWTQGKSQIVVFEEDSTTLTLNLPDCPPKVVDHWKIIPTTTQIEKQHLQKFQLGTIIPSCSVVLLWTGSENMQHLLHKVEIKGAKKPMDYVFLQYFPQTTGGRELTTATSLASSSVKGQKGPPPLSSPPSGAAFLNKVASRIPAKWKLFAFNLGFESDTLDAFEQKNTSSIECFMKVFSAWKSNPSPPFTWETVIKVLQSPSVGGKHIAVDIRRSRDL